MCRTRKHRTCRGMTAKVTDTGKSLRLLETAEPGKRRSTNHKHSAPDQERQGSTAPQKTPDCARKPLRPPNRKIDAGGNNIYRMAQTSHWHTSVPSPK